LIRNMVLLMSAVGVMALVACAESSQSQPQSKAASGLAAAPAAAAQAPVETGGFVGNHIPDFDMTLVDGSTVSSASLLTAAEPAYLFFFATW